MKNWLQIQKQQLELPLKKLKVDIEQGSKQYNDHAQKVADKLPGNIGRMTARYPWMTVSVALILGLFLGGFLKYILSPHELTTGIAVSHFSDVRRNDVVNGYG
ncbi:MAG: hypothetical protein AB9891_13430 [Anaerolineaceae bacterium]